MTTSFVHLDVHTEYSIIDGLCRLPQLYQKLVKLNMPAVAITDECNLFAMVKSYRLALSHGIKPILGASFWIYKGEKRYRLTLLCQNTTGFKHLSQLISKAYLTGHKAGPGIAYEWLTQHTQGLLAFLGEGSDIAQALLADDHSKAINLTKAWQTLFPNALYFKVQDTGVDREQTLNHLLADLASQEQIPVVATNAVRFIEPDDFDAHEARVCIHQGTLLNDDRRPKNYTRQQFLKSPEQMSEQFAWLPQAITNTIEVAKRCNLMLTLDKPILPHFDIPGDLTPENYLAEQAKIGLKKRFAKYPVKNENIYDERLDIELKVINSMGFASYFLIVADFIHWAKTHDIPVGPGRGSGAGSLVAYATEITDLDPMQYDLLFERFLNPERVSMPDFDIDFCMQRRDEVIDYVAQKYGRESVAQIITFGTMAAKAVIRDVGRVLGHPYPWVDRIAKMVPFAIGMTLDKALAEEEALKEAYQHDEEVRELIDLAKKLEGITRNAGKHAGGVVIAPSLMTDFTPIYCEAGSISRVTGLDKDDIEAAGLVKFDFLGLKTLTIIQDTVKDLKQKNVDIDINNIPLDDKKTFDLLKECQTTAVFQLESRGMKDLIKRLQPDCFEDIIALVALFRPGPLQSGMVDDFIDRKHGRAKIVYPHPLLEPILKPTYGVILYQEQVMQIAQVLAGYSLGAADLLRRAMGKKKPEEMAKQRSIFVLGAKGQNIDQRLANDIFDLMEKFAGYGFNKSHSAAYALVAYQTAYLKAHFKAPFMAAVLSADMQNTDKVVLFVEECAHLGIPLLPPNINQSDFRFTANDKQEVVYGLGAIKGAGEAALDIMLAARKKIGAFKDIFQLCENIDTKKVNRRVMEALINAGALDVLGGHRASLLATLEKAMKYAEQSNTAAAGGQGDLFAGVGIKTHDCSLLTCQPFAKSKLLQSEKATLGFYLSGHPIHEHLPELKQFITTRIGKISLKYGTKMVLTAGILQFVRVIKTRRNQKMAVIALDDDNARIDVTLFPEDYELSRHLLKADTLLVCEGEISLDTYNQKPRITAKRIMTLEKARARFAKGLLVNFLSEQLPAQFSDILKETLKPYVPGRVAVKLRLGSQEQHTDCALGKNWQVNPSNNLLDALGCLPGFVKAKWIY